MDNIENTDNQLNHQAIMFDLALDSFMNLAERQGIAPEYLGSIRLEWEELLGSMNQLATSYNKDQA